MGRHISILVAAGLVLALAQGAALAAEQVTLKIEGLTRFG